MWHDPDRVTTGGDGDGVERRRRGGEGNGVNALGSDELGRAHTLAELGSDAQTLAELESDELGRAQTLAAGLLVIKRLITDVSDMGHITDGSIMEPSVICLKFYVLSIYIIVYIFT